MTKMGPLLGRYESRLRQERACKSELGLHKGSGSPIRLARRPASVIGFTVLCTEATTIQAVLSV